MATRRSIYNRTAEAEVLGAVLLDHRCYDVEAVSALQPDDFFVPAHSAVWGAMLGMLKDGMRPDIVLLEQALRATDELTLVGGLEGLGNLADRYAPTHNVAEHAGIVASLAKLRAAQMALAEMLDAAHDVDHRDVPEFMATCASRIAQLQQGAADGLRSFASVVRSALEDAKARKSGTRKPYSWGLTEVNRKFDGGPDGGHLVTIAARPAMGKTVLALNSALTSAHRDECPLLFSLEMMPKQLGRRAIASRGEVNTKSTKDPTEAAWVKMSEAHDHFLRIGGKIWTGPITLDRLVAVSRAWRRSTRRPGPIYVDYLQLLELSGPDRRLPREQQVATMTRTLKKLAIELDVPVKLLAQLNRDLEKRDDKRPKISDLRESGAIEQDSDAVVLLYRPIVYDGGADPKAAEVIVAKNREGITGTARVHFEGHFSRFIDAPDTEERSAPGFTYQDGQR